MATSDSNSADTSSGDGGSNTGDSGGGSGGSGNTSPSIDSLTSSMKQFGSDKKTDLKLTADARTRSLQYISDYRDGLKNQLAMAEYLGAMGNPGTFASAIQTKNYLLDDMNGPGGVKDTINKSIKYLDELEATVKKAADSLLHNG